jgi:hypothetical protein
MYNLNQLAGTAITALYNKVLDKGYRQRTIINRYTWNHEFVERMPTIMTGDIAVNTVNKPHRRCSVQMIRPRTSLAQDDLWINDIYRVWQEIHIPEVNSSTHDYRNGGWVGVPVFFGSMAPGGMKVEDDRVTLNLYGYEKRWMYPLGWSTTIRKGTYVHDAIKIILTNFENEINGRVPWFAIHETEEKLSSDFVYGTSTLDGNKPVTPWDACRMLAWSMGGYEIFVSADGIVTTRPPDQQPDKYFTEDNRRLLKPPSIDVNMDEFVNRVIMRGDKHERGQYFGYWSAKGRFAPENLKELFIREETGVFGSNRACADAARARLNELLVSRVAVNATVLPEPRLEEYDWVQVNYDGNFLKVPAKQFNIPLVTGSMSISSERRRLPHYSLQLRNRRLY